MGIFDRARQLLSSPTPPPVAETANDALPDDPRKMVRSVRQVAEELYSSTSAVINAVTGLGTASDPSTHNRWAYPRPLEQHEQSGMGRNALISQVLGKLPSTATREGWRVGITDSRVEDPQLVADTIAAYETRLGIGSATARAGYRCRQYGESLVWLGVDDGRDFHEPVDWDNVKRIRWAVVIDRRDFRPLTLYSADSDRFTEVETFQIVNLSGVLEDGLRYGSGVTLGQQDLKEAFATSGGQLVLHAERVLHFATDDFLPLLDTLQDALGDYFTAMHGVSTAARNSSTIIYKITNWIRKAWAENGALAHTHIKLLDRAVSALGAYIVDSDHEQIEIVNRNLSGVAELPDPFMVWISAALGIPITEFWGVSPGGYGKGDAERENWHATVRAFQSNVLTPLLNPLHDLILVAEDGCQLTRDIERTILYEDLSPPDEETRSKLRNEALDAIRQLFKDQLISREEARPGIVALTDDYFRPELDLKQRRDAEIAPVGVFTAATAVMQALYPPELGGIPVSAARELMLALASAYFTVENVQRVFPERSAPATPPAAATSTSTNGALTEGASEAGTGTEPEAENTDEQSEPNEIDLAWSQNPVPPDAIEAPAIAAELNIPTVRVTRAHKAGLIEGWNVLGGKPRYSLSEVKRVVLQGNGKLPATSSATDASNEPCTCGIMLRAPKHVAQWVPYKPEDTTAPHVTVLYVGKISPAQLLVVLDVVRTAALDCSPINVALDGLDYFDSEQRVAFARVVPNDALFGLHSRLRTALELIGITSMHYEGGFTPHLTLAYLESDEDYTGPMPSEGWTATEVEVWYDDFAIPVPLGDSDQTPSDIESESTNAEVQP